MKNASHNSILSAFVVSCVFLLSGSSAALAATTPSLGAATTYAVLGSTYTNTTAGSVINGDIGFTTGPAVAPGGVHTNYGSGAPYASAGTDQGAALAALASQPCTFTFAAGAINLSTDTTHGTAGIYAPGVYCSAGAMDVGGPLSLSGSGTFIFRPTGALTSTAGAVVTLAGASECDVFWTPTQATTLAANTTFVGTIIGDAGITVGANTTWAGRSLAFSGTVTTDTTTITAPACSNLSHSIPGPTPATLHIIKVVVNASGGTAVSSDFTLHVKSSGVDVVGSPAVGTLSPGTFYSLNSGVYTVSENAHASFTQSFSGDCDVSGNVTLISSVDKVCTVTNTGISIVTVAPSLPIAPTPIVTPVPLVVTPVITVEAFPNTIDTPNPSSTPSVPSVIVFTPKFPNTGFFSQENSIQWILGGIASFVAFFLIILTLVLRKRTI